MGEREPVLWVARDEAEFLTLHLSKADAEQQADRDYGAMVTFTSTIHPLELPDGMFPTLAPGRVVRVTLTPDEEWEG